jgi:hypothetical protein
METRDSDGGVERLLETLGLQRRTRSSGAGQWLGPFVLGVVVGATLANLFSSNKRRESRKEMEARIDKVLAESETAAQPGRGKASASPVPAGTPGR